MTSLQEQNQHIDPRLEELLDLLHPTPQMDPEMVARGQAKFLTEVDALFGPMPSSSFSWLTGWFTTLYMTKEKFVMATSKQKFVYATLAVFIAIFVLLFGGASATAYASQYSLPGDALYPVKTGLEQTQVRLSSNAADQAELHLEFAQRRLVEIAALIDEGRFNDINKATSEFEYHTQQAIDALQVVVLGDPARAEDLATQIASALSSYARTLSGMMANVPDPVKPAFEHAMMASQSAGSATDEDEIEFTGVVEAMAEDSWTVEGRELAISSQTEIEGSIIVGDLVEVHAFTADDGTLTAREIELVMFDDNSNEENMGNDNDDFDDDDDYGNENMAGDDNNDDYEDDDYNDNDDVDNMNDDDYNDNHDDDGNFNGDDDDNANSGDDNDNDNGDDDNGNDNGDDGDDNSNDGGGDDDNSNDDGDDDDNDNGGGDGDDEDNSNS